MKVVLAPTTSSAVPGQDFYDALGRRWICNGQMSLRSASADDRAQTEAASPTPALSLRELAEKLRPRRLVGQYEYQLAEPDMELAEKILAMTMVPVTNGHRPTLGELDGLNPKFVIAPTDDRQHVIDSAVPPGSSTAKLSQNCTATMIGRSTALGAAHCFFNNGWIATAWMAFGANNWGTMTTPFGTYVFDSITIPGQWNSNEWDFDFAVLEFSPTRYPGDQTGWLGTEWNMSGWQYEIGYPLDKVYPSQWATYGTYTASAGGRYEHNLDLVPGDSGACVYNASYRCTGIQSTQWDAGGRKWNEVRRWDSTTHNFFDAYGNWP